MIEVMLAKRAEKDCPELDSKEWVAERKFDGTRAIMMKLGREIEFWTRSWKTELSQSYPDIIMEAHKSLDITGSFIIDGEIVAYDKKGNEKFITARMTPETKQNYKIVYHVFDIILLNGEYITKLPYLRRKEILTKLIGENEIIKTTKIWQNKRKLLQEVNSEGGEGIILKHKDSIYEIGKRSKYWLKVKNEKTADLIVKGWLPPSDDLKTDKRKGKFGALVCYQYDKEGTLLEVCNVGGGFTDADLKLITDKYLLPGGKVKEEFIIEAKYLNITEDGHYRMPTFVRLRDDKLPRHCIMERDIKRGGLEKWF